MYVYIMASNQGLVNNDSIWRMPMRLILLAGLHGVLFALFPIGWIILAALFLYNVTVETGQFALVKESVARRGPSHTPPS